MMTTKSKKKAVDPKGRWSLFKKFVIICFVVLIMITMVLLSQVIPEERIKTNPALKFVLLQTGEVVARSEQFEERISIAKRIHQMYKAENIPQVYVPYIQTWLKNHPQWEYWFWNDLDTRRLIIDHYPDFLDMYDSYSNNLLRSDASRYFILHHYGGVYADMDMDSFRPVDPLVFNYTCIFSQEPYIQSRLLYDRSSIAMNAWMACAEKHPFMTFVIEELANFARPIQRIEDTIHITGPVMLQETITRYMNKTDCKHSDNCHVFIAPPDMFMPTWDQGQKSNFLRKCRKIKKLSPKQADACFSLKAAKFINHIPADVYGNHKFLHIGYKDGKYETSKSVNINDIVKKTQLHRYAAIENGKMSHRCNNFV